MLYLPLWSKEIIHILQIRKYVVFNDKAIMPVSLTNSIDIVANSVSICDEDSVADIFSYSCRKQMQANR